MNIYNPKIKDIELEDIIAIDSEFNSLNAKSANISVISINNPIAGVSYALDVNGDLYSNKEILELLEKVAACKIVLAHNAKADMGVIHSNYGILLRNCWCTMMASQLIDNGYGYKVENKETYTANMVGGIEKMLSPHGLYGCIRRYLGIDLSETIDKKQLQKSFINLPRGRKISQEQLEYAAADVSHLYNLYLAELKYIEERGQEKQVILENTVTPCIIKMEQTGCLFDKSLQKDNIKKWKQQLTDTEHKLDQIVVELAKTNPKLQGGIYTNKRVKEELIQHSLFDGMEKTVANENKHNLNYSSATQLKELFTRVGVDLPVDDEGKISFGEESLKTYITNYSDSLFKEFLLTLLDYREYGKLLSTYGENLLNLVDKDSRLRTNYTQCFTNSGRLTSSAIIRDELGLNLSNLPQNKDLRKAFIPDPGYSFVDCDLTAQEVAIVAGYSGEKVLLKAIKEGFDHHSFLASKSYSIIFGEEVEIKNESSEIEINGFKYDTKKLRDDHKACLFSVLYLGGPKRILIILNKYFANHIEPKERMNKAVEVSNAIQQALPDMMKYLKGLVRDGKRLGYTTTTKWNRRRYFDNPENAYGEIANHNIQSTGALSIKVALINIEKWFINKSKELGISEKELGWITFSIYDQNLCCLNNKYLDLAPEIQKIMASALEFFLKDLKGKSDLFIRTEWGK